MLLGPRVDDGVDEVVARPLLRHGRAPARKEHEEAMILLLQSINIISSGGPFMACTGMG